MINLISFKNKLPWKLESLITLQCRQNPENLRLAEKRFNWKKEN
jgi:hypothetical protein